MDSSRASSLQEFKLEKQLDDDNEITAADERSMTDDRPDDLEKGPQPLPSQSQSSTDNNQQITSEEQEKKQFLVKWDENDPKNPKNWNRWYKVYLTFQLGMLALTGSLGSSIISPAQDILSKEFGVSREVTVLLVALYVLGFACGPSIWAPLAETYGRRISILPAIFCLALFSIGTATSNSFSAILVTRFFGGVFGSAPISNVSAALGDIYLPASRGTAVTFYALAVTGGPTIGPVIGSALTVNLGWRWTEYILAIWAFTNFTLSFFTLPETYELVLLKRKAKALRKETGDDRWWHPHESARITIQNVLTKHISRPLRMLFTEPMVTTMALYASFVYGILYLTLEVFPIVYLEARQWGLVVSTLPFLAVLVGVCFAVLINLANQPYYQRAVAANKGRAVPEARLPPVVAGGFMFTIGLFWFAWTAEPNIPWPASTVAAGFIGAGFSIIFQQCINFLVDTYGLYAASAVAANTFLRSLLACGLPLAATPMYRNLGIGPATSILGAVSVLALPLPFVFMKYGLKLRKMSKFAPVVED